jgi:valyl-tRNA synthetase
MAQDLPKAYIASEVEDAIYAAWEASGVFNPDQLPDRNQNGEPYCIMMPPPNRTGVLHLGHATMLAIEDLLIRFQRMRGKRTLWVPGTDHAAISTQVKVEQLLIKEGMKDPRRELGREGFLDKVRAFAEESGRTINKQVRKMGSSCDWSREAYTFDEPRGEAVNKVFGMMFEDGIIERGYRLVNWDPQFRTTLSDDEVFIKEGKAKLYTFTYDKDFPIAVSTTRPETKFGDTAVAVHPSDERYQSLIGKRFQPVFCGKKLDILVIADEAVDPAFGTGALGVTPAHSMIDEQMGQRHGLPMIQVIGEDGCLLAECGSEFAGLSIKEARGKIEERLQSEGVLREVKEIDQNLPIAERGGAPVEQLPMRQWFIRVNKPFTLRQDTLNKWKKGESVTLKELMREAVLSNQTRILPERFFKTYFTWVDNLRDWCISRQIWFGHQIPVWYRGDETVFGVESPGEGWVRDPDTLDTWFSSGMWTFSALGWPNKGLWEKQKSFHPTAVLETGYDILFFWVARMILMSSYALGEVPFKDVYLHGLVRDEQGRKMSKSLGNVLDPLDLIPKYGTDAVRLSLVIGSTPGQDVNLSESKIESYRNFTNKLWNISRFILTSIDASSSLPSSRTKSDEATSFANDGGGERDLAAEQVSTLADTWISARLNEVVASVTKKLETYQLSAAGEELREFTWSDLADWYLEIAKVEGGKTEILIKILQTVLKLWHPFAPFVTEHVWKVAGFPRALIVAEWPTVSGKTEHDVQAFEGLKAFVTDIRRLRAEQKIEPAKAVEFVVVGGGKEVEPMKENLVWIQRLVNASSLQFVDVSPQDWPSVVSGSLSVAMNMAGLVDVAAEREKAKKELADLERYIQSTQQKLENQEFVGKAPEKVVEGMRQKLEEAKKKAEVLTKKANAG